METVYSLVVFRTNQVGAGRWDGEAPFPAMSIGHEIKVPGMDDPATIRAIKHEIGDVEGRKIVHTTVIYID